ncbi:MAG TPA: alanine/glycine:cation symporter family protein [Pyrinomonadaceae bacterium]|nr:alanine/glycine:cation symporter family protein [Pyrinomonadaceae bacterium]HMP65419.1 alanine/glycine:cation symporter family protein [Pyrinomonadaceae bacterium]
MNHKVRKIAAASFAAFVLPFLTFAQEAGEKGLDQRIDEAFKPYADGWEALVFYPAPLPEPFNLPIVLYLLIVGAVFFTVVFGFVNIRKFPLALSVVRGKYDDIEMAEADPHAEVHITDSGDIPRTIRDEGKHGEVSHFQALATAVSGTVGLGNIAGVAVAVGIGGPGATLWMIIAGLLGMSSKFVECTLGVKYRDVDSDGTVHGGPMYYLSRGLGEMNLAWLGKILAVVFAVFCVGGSLGGGNAFQANQATSQITTMFDLQQSGAARTLIGIVMAILVAIVIIGGIKRIANVTAKLVPLMAVIYIIASIIIILAHLTEVPAAIGMIISGAFTPEAGVGGVAGVIIQGFRRAAFSNEAGAGSAAIAHSAVRTKYPASEGLVALLEPFIDTVVICTMTAIVIVLFNMQGDFFQYGGVGGNVMIDGQAVNGVDLTARAYNDVLPGFNIVLTVAIVLFAFSTMISWSYYGLQSWKYLFGRSNLADLTFKLLFCLFVVIGAAASLGSVLAFSDAMILAMVFPNMIGLFFLFPRVREELARYLKAIGKA